jgi:hypothetical protein
LSRLRREGGIKQRVELPARNEYAVGGIDAFVFEYTKCLAEKQVLGLYAEVFEKRCVFFASKHIFTGRFGRYFSKEKMPLFFRTPRNPNNYGRSTWPSGGKCKALRGKKHGGILMKTLT